MDVTLSPMVTAVKPVQPEKALSPTVVTLSGMVTEVRPVQPENAPLGIWVTLLPILTVVIAVIPEKLPDVQFVALKLTVVNCVQFLNASSPIEVTPAGMVIEVSPVQPLKADADICVI